MKTFVSTIYDRPQRLTGRTKPMRKAGGLRRALPRKVSNSPYRRGLLALSLLLHTTALAGPAGEQVTAGSATVSRPDAVTTLITQQSQKAVIDWQNFSIGLPEMVRFQQPDAGSVVLNRVLGNDPSLINGQLDANGQVFLVNPNGVLFTPDSQVSVHGLLATTLDISNSDFMAGHYLFAKKEALPTGAEVANQGTIQASDHGYIVLAGDYAANSGVIQARLGQVALASGNRFTLDLEGDQLIGLAVDEASLAKRAGVENFGTLAADGGQVVMTAKVAGELTTTVVNNAGLIQARSIEEQNGEIILHGGSTGTVVSSGTLDASGQGVGETGGSVQVLGDKVGLLDHAIVDVSGQKGGGTALIGGDYQGNNPEIQNAQATYVGTDSVIKADAIEKGDGGRVIVWADNTTRAYGNISARGGEMSGDGGFVEVSGKGYLDTGAEVDTRAPHGAAGTLLLDPTDITITTLGGAPDFGSFTGDIFGGGANSVSSMGWDYINGLLSANNVIVQTSSAGAGTGTITFTGAGVSAGGANSLSFLAENSITVSNSIQYTSSGDLIMVAGWLPASGYVTPLATHASNPGNMLVNADITSTGGGNIKLLAKGDLAIANATISTNGSGGMALSATNITLDGLSGATRAEVLGSGNQTVTATNTLEVKGGNALNEYAYIKSGTGDQTISASALNTLGGSATGAYATIGANGGNQNVTVGGGGLTISGGSANGAYADIYQGVSPATQTITITGAGDVSITGGSAADGARAGIFSASTGLQTLNFTTGGNTLTLTGGTSGIHNQAEVGNISSAPVSVLGYAAITLNGGASGAASSSAESNSAHIGSDSSAVTIQAATLSLNGSAANYADASISGGTIALNVTGTTSLTGGAGTDAAAAIGTDGATTAITLTSGGAISLSGNATAGKGLAGIGSLGGNADITINGTTTITADYAGIGSFTGSDIYGVGSVTMTAGGNIVIANSAIGGLSTDALIPAKGLVYLFSTGGTLTLGSNTLVRGGQDIRLIADTVSINPTAKIIAGTPSSGYAYPSGGFVTIQPATSTRPMNVAGTPVVGGALNLTDADLARINPAGWVAGNTAGVTAGGGVLFGQTTAPLVVTGELFEPGDGMFINLRGSTIDQTAGSIIHETLDAQGGSITLLEANTINRFTANSSGGILLNTVAPTLQIFNNVSSTGSGDITITAGGDLAQTAGTVVSTTGAGFVNVNATNISAGTGTLASTGTGPISYLATGTTTVDSSQLSTTGTKTVTGTYTGEVAVEPPPPPTIDQCTTNPTLPGCTAVLPTINTCTATPTAPGCTAVLPPLADCTTNPTLPGCSAVLPPLADFTTTPALPGCTAVLPTIDTCTTTPTAPGCSAVLPPLADCTTNPTLPGCIAVLPTIDTCTSTPTAPGCSAVLPPLTDCTTNSTLSGCTAVLPTINTCTSTPAAPGCSAVLPPLADCVTNPSKAGCTAVLPQSASNETPVEIVNSIQSLVMVDMVMPPQTDPTGIGINNPNSTSEQSASSSDSNDAASNGNDEEKEGRKAEEVPLNTDSKELPLARRPLFDFSGGGIAGQNMVCK